MILSKKTVTVNAPKHISIKEQPKPSNSNHVYGIGFNDSALRNISEELNQADYYKVHGTLTAENGLKHLQSINPKLRHGIVLVTAKLALHKNFKLLKQLKIINQQSQILVIGSSDADDAICADFFHMGAAGYFNLNASAGLLRVAVTAIRNKHYYAIFFKHWMRTIYKPKLSELPKLPKYSSEEVLRVLRLSNYRPAKLPAQEKWLFRAIYNSFGAKTYHELLYAALKFGVIGGGIS
jgi:DNA-binding NarL/FixJ family response regulator